MKELRERVSNSVTGGSRQGKVALHSILKANKGLANWRKWREKERPLSGIHNPQRWRHKWNCEDLQKNENRIIVNQP